MILFLVQVWSSQPHFHCSVRLDLTYGYGHNHPTQQKSLKSQLTLPETSWVARIPAKPTLPQAINPLDQTIVSHHHPAAPTKTTSKNKWDTQCMNHSRYLALLDLKETKIWIHSVPPPTPTTDQRAINLHTSSSYFTMLTHMNIWQILQKLNCLNVCKLFEYYFTFVSIHGAKTFQSSSNEKWYWYTELSVFLNFISYNIVGCQTQW